MGFGVVVEDTLLEAALRWFGEWDGTNDTNIGSVTTGQDNVGNYYMALFPDTDGIGVYAYQNASLESCCRVIDFEGGTIGAEHVLDTTTSELVRGVYGLTSTTALIAWGSECAVVTRSGTSIAAQGTSGTFASGLSSGTIFEITQGSEYGYTRGNSTDVYAGTIDISGTTVTVNSEVDTTWNHTADEDIWVVPFSTTKFAFATKTSGTSFDIALHTLSGNTFSYSAGTGQLLQFTHGSDNMTQAEYPHGQIGWTDKFGNTFAAFAVTVEPASFEDREFLVTTKYNSGSDQLVEIQNENLKDNSNVFFHNEDGDISVGTDSIVVPADSNQLAWHLCYPGPTATKTLYLRPLLLNKNGGVLFAQEGISKNVPSVSAVNRTGNIKMKSDLSAAYAVIPHNPGAGSSVQVHKLSID